MELNYDSEYGANVDTHLEIIKPFPEGLKIIADVIAVQMGEYTLNVGVHLDTDFCELAESPNSLAVPILRAINMDSGTCPPEPGIYEREGYVLDSMDGLPSAFPAGHYLLNMSLIYEESVLFHLDVYLRIY
ncbi:hypothetical protein WH47_01812 [Habropoda laboriosa]|uniref:MD-2-related lipid-recognition domain-containing protein n=2 Tax=Habropoda laboriosa TaxID=597456 RepID=A0A0L7QTR9_9HYME|nr:hypothetical protein WH47_01812 [Habropoda laboriosa]